MVKRDIFNELDFHLECVLAKQNRVSFDVLKYGSTWVLNYVHSNVNEPVSTASIGELYIWYSLLMTTCVRFEYVLKARLELFEKIKFG